MSGKFKGLSIALAVLMAFGFYAATAKADVTGSFGVAIDFSPIPCQQVVVGPAQTPVNLGDQPCEVTVYKFDFQGDLNVNVAISGLTMGFHSHLGTTGLEDVLLTFAATLGALDVNDTFVFAQPYGWIVAGDGQLIPACYENAPGSGECDLLFVKKRVEASISIGGVTFSNLAILEDTTFPPFYDPLFLRFGLELPVLKPTGATYTSADQNFGFGDVVSVSGQTPSGITVSGTTGICASLDVNNIKKHRWNYMVNPDCAAGTQTPSPKPPLFFDFETLSISGIPLAADLFVDFDATCEGPGFDCSFGVTAIFTGSPIFNPIIAFFSFDTPAGFSFDLAFLQLPAGPVTFTLWFDDTFDLFRVDMRLGTTLNPDTNPASLDVFARVEPGTGLTRLDITLSVERAGLSLSATSRFSGTPATLSAVILGLQAEAGVIAVGADVTYIFGAGGGLGGTLTASVAF